MAAAPSPLVSIISPVYNEAADLGECIESVLAQTYRNWDYTIVDNCSTDETVRIARRYAERDPRIRVKENQQFLKAIPNHNRALRELSRGSKYCKVLLGDDWMFPECLERMVAVAEEHPSVALVGAYSLDSRNVHWVGLPYRDRVMSGREIGRRHFLDQLFLFGSATSVLYRADLVRVRDPFYNEANVHSDVEVCFDLLKDGDFGFVHQILTYTRDRPHSMSSINERIQTSLPGYLRTLLAHGRDYLSAREFEHCVSRHMACYYAFLGKSLLLGRGRAFWTYHKRELADAGIRFSPLRVVGGAVTTIFQGLGHAKQISASRLESP